MTYLVKYVLINVFFIADFMIEIRGSGRGSMIKCTHNQQIKRLWKDVFNDILALHCDIFTFMEENDIVAKSFGSCSYTSQ